MHISKLTFNIKRFFQQKVLKQDVSEINYSKSWIDLEYEFFEKENTMSYRTKKNNVITIGELLSTLYDIKDQQISTVIKIDNSNNTSIVTGNYWNIPLYDNSKNQLIYNIKLHDPEIKLKNNYSFITIHICPELSEEHGTTYLNVNLFYSPGSNIKTTKKQKYRLNIAHDNHSFSQAKAEYLYIKEMVEKHNEYPNTSLSKNEWKLLTLINNDISTEYYWGKKSFGSGNYIGAISYFNNVYEELKRKWYKNGLTSKEMNLFTECSYYIGFSFDKLSLYDKAYLYLEMASRSNNETTKYKREFLNCLISTKNILSIIYIDDYLQDIKKIPEGEHTRETLDFFYFLLRKKALVLIEMDQYEDAEYILYRLLEKEPNNDDIINELALLQKKKRCSCGGS